MIDKLNFKLLCALVLSVLLAACSSSDDDDPDNAMDEMTNPPASEVAFAFATTAPGDYANRIDRMGMPAIATALITSKDSYNQRNPVDDTGGEFVSEILVTLGGLHTALDGQLQGLGLTPCTVNGDGTGSCAAFAVPLIIPDTLKINTAAAAGFPNGRMLADPVIDVTLAVALLELTGDPAPHAPDALVGVLNPAANDKEFMSVFPFLAAPH